MIKATCEGVENTRNKELKQVMQAVLERDQRMYNSGLLQMAATSLSVDLIKLTRARLEGL
jgi:hypothetical protein